VALFEEIGGCGLVHLRSLSISHLTCPGLYRASTF
jgi:hypothetical protein